MPAIEHPTEWPGVAKATLTRKVGPLPVWGWVAVTVGGIVAFVLIKKRAGTSSVAATNPVASAVAGGFAGNYGTGGGGGGGGSTGDTGSNPPSSGGVGDGGGSATDYLPPVGSAQPVSYGTLGTQGPSQFVAVGKDASGNVVSYPGTAGWSGKTPTMVNGIPLTTPPELNAQYDAEMAKFIDAQNKVLIANGQPAGMNGAERGGTSLAQSLAIAKSLNLPLLTEQFSGLSGYAVGMGGNTN